ncbi:DTW domain-containing protein [Shewanella sedimentimangrovi]|uniref:tRNA-uridine aminocarboxypropyltransferase n=1 Tax=Shewanella sedimentimangrovi TaxID=2814293 RepID=A0ABX7R6W7_9GAMM|nr:tRNA-uridine aminocarboxypropyltransferase [Shewanella sedimentimangrovi]QSX38820.1 DTW domain-containing protein [Shewanella sedimentimangrovi]
MEILLLTHERELGRSDNSGQLALQLFPQLCRRLLWQRRQPLVLPTSGTYLLYPADADEPRIAADELAETDQVIILDGTWQEAHKMLRQSPWLRVLPRVSLSQLPPSRFRLRRNQREDGLCTAECIAALWQASGRQQQALTLMEQFELWQLKMQGQFSKEPVKSQ